MAERLPPLFENGLYGCPRCGSPDIEFRDFRTQDRSFAIAGMCHGLGEATAIHRWVVIMTMTTRGMRVRIEGLHDDVSFPGRPSQPQVLPGSPKPVVIQPFTPSGTTLEHQLRESPGGSTLEHQLRESLIALGIDPDKPPEAVERELERKFRTIVGPRKNKVIGETQP